MARTTVAEAEGVAEDGDASRPRQKRTLLVLSQHQFCAFLATSLDYCIMIACVSLLGLSPVVGTVLGALVGAVTNFMLGRRWVFDARSGDVRGQALRYALVSAVSLTCNATAEWLLVRAGLQYVGGRVLASITIGVGWNFPMHRHFVFRTDATPAPVDADEAAPSAAPDRVA